MADHVKLTTLARFDRNNGILRLTDESNNRILSNEILVGIDDLLKFYGLPDIEKGDRVFIKLDVERKSK